MEVTVKYLDGSRKIYNNVDDVDADADYIDIYTDPAGDEEPCIGLDLNLVKAVYVNDGIKTDRIYFNKKEVSIMKEENTKAIKEAEAAEAEAAEALEAAEASEADDDFDFAEEFNHGNRLFTIDTEGFEGHKASEVFAEAGSSPLLMRAVYVNADNGHGYGESVSVVTTNSIIYFGKSNVENANKIRSTVKAVDKLNKTGAWFKIVEFKSKKYKKTGYSFEFLKKEDIPAEFNDDDACFKW